MVSTLYENETFLFFLQTVEKENAERIPAGEKAAETDSSANSRISGSGAKIIRRSKQSGEEVVLFSYTWPVQLTVRIEAGEGMLREDGILCWQLHVTAHHVSGMAKGSLQRQSGLKYKAPSVRRRR